MAAINNSLPSLADHMNRLDPGGGIAQIVEILMQRNTVLADSVWQEGNLATGHRFTSRVGLPTVSWRRLNEGVNAGKSATDQIDESCGLLSGMHAVDVEVAKLGGNEAAFRLSESQGFLQAFNNELNRAIVYESTKTNPERMHGIAPRLGALTGNYGNQILNAAGTGTSHLTSIYLINWGPESVFLIYPKGSTGGLEPADMGIQLWDDGSGKKFRAYVTQWTWKVGMVVKDYRQVVRICNINTNTLVKDAATGADLINLMVKAYYQLFDPQMGRPVFYCNRTIAAWLHIQAMTAVKNSTLSIETVMGKPVVTCLGIPIHVNDSIVGYNGGTVAAGTAESQVS